MTQTSLDELGPVDYLVVEFPAGQSTFTGEMVSTLHQIRMQPAQIDGGNGAYRAE